MKLIKYPDRSQWNEILKRPVLETEIFSILYAILLTV